MSKYVNRKGWSARNPTDFVALDWGKVDKFIIHYSGASRDQTVRSIQNYCMDKKGHSDIDYNDLIKGDTVYEGRGEHVGGHTFGLNSTSYGVCVIGQDGDATEEDLACLQERYAYACGKANRKLTIYGHGEAPGQKENSGTDCPGSEIYAWIHDGRIDDTAMEPDEPASDVVTALPEVRLGHGNPKAVKLVQAIVNQDSEPAYQLLLEDGIFGPNTHKQVSEWQARHNVPNSVRPDGSGDGHFGPACWTYALTLD